jgi:hypothetical protein
MGWADIHVLFQPSLQDALLKAPLTPDLKTRDLPAGNQAVNRILVNSQISSDLLGGQKRLGFHGIPLLVKTTKNASDKMPPWAGSPEKLTTKRPRPFGSA